MLHTHKNSTGALVLLTALVAPLAACGGSSSSSSSGPNFNVRETGTLRVAGIEDAAESLPLDGSVTQGSRVTESGDDQGRTLDIVSVSQKTGTTDNTDVIVTINVEGEGTIMLDIDATGSPDPDGDSTEQDANDQLVGITSPLDDPNNAKRSPGWDYRTRLVSISEADFDRNIEACEADISNCGSDEGGVFDYGALFVDWTDDDAAYYMAGGVWYYGQVVNNQVEASYGGFTDGDETLTQIPTTSSARYSGHSSGFVLDGLLDDPEYSGIFTASLDMLANFGTEAVDFGDGTTRVSVPGDRVFGRLTEFRFSEETDFRDDVEDTMIPGEGTLTVDLQAAEIDNANNFFEGTTQGTLVETDPTAITTMLEGRWGGKFFGAATSATSNEPPGIGGTWGATAERLGRSLSFIGSFGAKRDAESGD